MNSNQKPPAPKNGMSCPLHKLPVEKVCHKCAWYMRIQGKNPQTGDEMDNWGCAMEVLPILMLENALQTRGAAAATEMARDAIVETVTGTVQIMQKIVESAAPQVEDRKSYLLTNPQ